MKKILLVWCAFVFLLIEINAQMFHLEMSGRVSGNFNIPTRNVYLTPGSYFEGADLYLENFISTPSDTTLTLNLTAHNNFLKDSLNIFIALSQVINSLIDSNNFEITYDSIGFLTFQYSFIDYSNDYYVDGIEINTTINKNVSTRSIVLKLNNQSFEIGEEELDLIIYSNVPRGTIIWMPLQVGNIWEYNEYCRSDSSYYDFQYKVIDSVIVNVDILYMIEKWQQIESVWSKVRLDTVKIDSANNIVDIRNQLYFFPDNVVFPMDDDVDIWNTPQQLAYFTRFTSSLPGLQIFGFAITGVGILSYYRAGTGEPPIYDIYLKGAKINGEIVYGQLTDISLITSETPSIYFLAQNYPNPFNPSTKISWQSPVSGWQTLKVYDILGNEVATLVDEYRNAGSYEVQFQSTVGNRQLANGVYFYQLKAGEYVETRKMILLK